MKRAILLVDHGSRHEEANAVLDEMARLVRARVPECIVRVAHMELALPTLDEAIDECAAEGAAEIVVQPYFLAPGRHSTRDIPELTRRAARRHPKIALRVTEPLGVHEALVDAILARVDPA